MKLIICGGREYDDYHALKRAIEHLKPTQIAHGAAPGADTIAGEIASHMRIPVRRFPAEKRYGRIAAYVRNSQMIKIFEPDAILAASNSRPTADLILKSLKKDVIVHALNPEREIVRLPKKRDVPRYVQDPEQYVAALIARAVPLNAFTKTSAAKPQHALQAIIGQAPFIDCGNSGDPRFNHHTATIAAHPGRSLFELYTAAKVFEGGITGLSPQEAHGKTPLNKDQLPKLYAILWDQYIRENPTLIDTLLRAQGVMNVHSPEKERCPATELWRIRSAEIERRQTLGLSIPGQRRTAPQPEQDHENEP